MTDAFSGDAQKAATNIENAALQATNNSGEAAYQKLIKEYQNELTNNPQMKGADKKKFMNDLIADLGSSSAPKGILPAIELAWANDNFSNLKGANDVIDKDSLAVDVKNGLGADNYDSSNTNTLQMDIALAKHLNKDYSTLTGQEGGFGPGHWGSYLDQSTIHSLQGDYQKDFTADMAANWLNLTTSDGQLPLSKILMQYSQAANTGDGTNITIEGADQLLKDCKIATHFNKSLPLGLTSDQANAVANLYNNWDSSAMQSMENNVVNIGGFGFGQHGVITADSIKQATGIALGEPAATTVITPVTDTTADVTSTKANKAV